MSTVAHATATTEEEELPGQTLDGKGFDFPLNPVLADGVGIGPTAATDHCRQGHRRPAFHWGRKKCSASNSTISTARIVSLRTVSRSTSSARTS